MKYFLSLLYFFSISWAIAQQTFIFDQSINILREGNGIDLPFAAGINAAQLQQFDINGNGEEELIIWDTNSRRILVFRYDEGSFHYLPEMGFFFPVDISGFLVLVDFDMDGKKDLFTSSPFGIKAYRNITPPENGFPEWEVAQDFLRLDNGSNLTANNLDIPLIMDIDGDGDLDIATFNFASGDYLDFYLNTSMERKGIADIDGFAFPLPRWGDFEFCGCGKFSFGVTCSGFPIGRVMLDSLENYRIQHAGGHSLLYADFNGDGVKDLLMGQDECSTLYFLPNKGTDFTPVFAESSTSVPGFGQLPEFPVFHTSYLWQNDLIISSNSSEVAGIFGADYAQNIFALNNNENTTTPFLQNEILDFGENSRPFFIGNSSNGQLIVTANALEGDKIIGKAFKLKTGENSWELLDEDYLALSELGYTDLQYLEYQTVSKRSTYWISGVDTVNFTLVRKLFLSHHPQLLDLLEVNVTGINLLPLDHFELFNYEGEDYLLLARQTGELILFEMQVATNATLTLKERDFLGFTDNPAMRNLSVHAIADPNPSLFAIDQRGVVIYLKDFMQKNNRESVEVQIHESTKSTTRFGRNTWMSHMSNPFGKNISLVIGNKGGGLEVLKQIDQTDNPDESTLMVRIFPNPTLGPIKILTSQDATASLINSMGQLILSNINVKAFQELEIQAGFLSPGLYIIQLVSENGVSVSKKLILLP